AVCLQGDIGAILNALWTSMALTNEAPAGRHVRPGLFYGLRGLSGCVDRAAAQISGLYRDGVELAGIGGKGVLPQDDKVGQEAGCDAAFAVFLKAGAGPGDGVAVQGLLNCEGLLRQVGPLAAEGPAGDRALEPRQDAGSLHRAVRAVADGDAPVQQGLPAVAGGGQPGAHPGLDDLDVVIQK